MSEEPDTKSSDIQQNERENVFASLINGSIGGLLKAKGSAAGGTAGAFLFTGIGFIVGGPIGGTAGFLVGLAAGAYAGYKMQESLTKKEPTPTTYETADDLDVQEQPSDINNRSNADK